MATTRSTVKSKKPRAKSKIKSKNSGVLTFLKRKPALVFIVVFGLVGSIFLFRSFAATTNLEAEGSTKTAEVVIGSDASASGGKYAQFATAAPLAKSSAQRFPGDPNPRVTGKAYWGADELENTSYKSRFEDPTGKSMSTVRRFWSSWSQRGNLAGQAKTDIAANRMPMYSIKPVGWTEMASGSRDGEIDTFLKSLDTAGGPVWLIIHHEPDGGGAKVGPKNEDDAGGAAAWVKMQQKFRQRINALGINNVALMAAMTGGFGGDLNQPKDNWWADNTFDAFLLDHYTYDLNNPVANHRYWKGFYEWADKKGIPYGTAELGIRSGGAEGVGYFLPTTDCSKLTPRGISADLDNKAGNRLNEFWEWGFNNNKDVIAHAYFDKCVNSGDSPYALGGQQLNVFRDILKNSTRVQRVKELSSTSTAPSTYGTLTSNIAVPTDGTYKLWVRMSAPDSANNAISAKFDSGASAKIGDFAIPANTWTWVDYENGNSADKATFNLAAGTRKITITGIEKGVKVDKFILTDTTCTPIGNGDNCSVVAPLPTTDLPPATPTGVKVTSVGNGEATITWNPNTESDFKRFAVRFKKSSDSDATYVWPATDLNTNSYKFTGLTNGAQYDLEVRAIDQAENKSDYGVTSATPNATPTTDVSAPSTPTNLTATTTSKSVSMSWSKSTDNVGVKDYIISRNGVQVGTTTSTSFTNGNLASGTYTYTVKARDTSNNTSSAVSTTKTVQNSVLK